MATSTPVLTIGPLPVNATGGNRFNDGTNTGIRSMEIVSGDIVVSIRTEYDRNGQSVWSPTYGTTNNDVQKDEINLNYPDEFLVSISGTSTVEFSNKHLVIRTLTIKSNTRTWGPYGTARADAQPFSTESTGCKIVGFHGGSGGAMDSIGTYLVPRDKISIGPFGGAGGDIFDDGTYPSIKKLEIGHGEGYVSMRTLYATANGQDDHWSDVHGRAVGGRVDPVYLASDEYLISLSGFCTEGSNPIVKSLTFQSNKGTYGPFGTTQGIPFSTSTTAGTGKIVGFHGTSADYINSIAAYFKPLP